MNDIEFYLYEDELWCITDGKNEQLTEHNTELIKNRTKTVLSQMKRLGSFILVHTKHYLNGLLKVHQTYRTISFL